MSKVTNYENYRVVVDPRRLGDLGSVSMNDSHFCSSEEDRQRQYRDRCHEIAADIKRHVDNAGIISVEFDTVGACQHCGSKWTETSDSYNGGCCSKDEEGAPK